MGLGQQHHVGWQNLGNASHIGRDGQQTTRGCLENGNAKRFGQGTIQKNVSTAQDMAYLVVWHVAQKLYPILQTLSLNHLFQHVPFRTITTNDKVDLGCCMAYLWNDTNQQIDTLSIHQT